MAKAKKKTTSKKSGAKHRVLLAGLFVTSIAILPTTILLFFGMLPSIIARFIDRSKLKTQTLTIAFLNFAAVFPFWFELIHGEHVLRRALDILIDPLHIVIMYGGALMGYLIDWGLSGIVSSMMIQKGQGRLKQIRKTQKELVDRWGIEVSGTIPLDANGFPIAKK